MDTEFHRSSRILQIGSAVGDGMVSAHVV